MESDELKFIPDKFDKASICKTTLEQHPEYWTDRQEEMSTLIDQVVSEIESTELLASTNPFPNLEEAKKCKAVWSLSGAGTFLTPVTSASGDSINRQPGREWTHWTDKKRLQHAVDIIRKISLTLAGINQDDQISEQEEKRLIQEFGPFLIYNGVPDQDNDLLQAIESGALSFPKKKLFIPEGDIVRTLDQVVNLQFPDSINFKDEDMVGIVTHAPHFPRLMRMVNKYSSLPDSTVAQPFPLIFENQNNEVEYAKGEILGVLGYVAKGNAELKPYPYLK